MQLPSNLNFDLVGGIIILGALVVAIFIVVVTFVIARFPGETHRYYLRDCLGNAQWDFTKSWASTLTVVGALLGTILGAVKMAPNQFILLNFFFALLAVVAPLVCNFLGRMETVGISSVEKNVSKIAGLVAIMAHPTPPVQPAPVHEKEYQTYTYQSYVLGFLVACTLTLWAVMGEMVTLVFILGDFPGFKPGDILLIIVQALFVLGAVLAGFYGWKTVPMTLQAQISHRKAMREMQIDYLMSMDTKMTIDTATDKVDSGPRPAQPSWSLL